jgi:hypothetical protein
MADTPVDLYAFGNRSGPRPPRPGIDLPVDESGMQQGHYFRLPAGTELPEGIAVVADGRDVRADSLHPASHYTLYSAVAMSLEEFVQRFANLPWQWAGNK